MSESDYIKKLFIKTHSLIHKQGLKQGTRDYRLRVEPKIAALRTLACESTDKIFKASLFNAIEKIQEKDTTLNLNSEINNLKVLDEDKIRLNDELLGFSKKLRRRVGDFKDSLEKDSDVLRDATKKIQENFESADIGLKKITEIGKDVSVIRIVFYAFVVFIVMYFIIRFL